MYKIEWAVGSDPQNLLLLDAREQELPVVFTASRIFFLVGLAPVFTVRARIVIASPEKSTVKSDSYIFQRICMKLFWYVLGPFMKYLATIILML